MARPTRPGFGGAIEDAVDAIRSTFGPGTKRSDAAGKGGVERSDAIDDAVSKAAGGGDSVAGDESNHSSTVASHAGAQAQSTDHQNTY